MDDRSRQARQDRPAARAEHAAGRPDDLAGPDDVAGGPGAARNERTGASGEQNEAPCAAFVEEHYGHVFAVCYGVLLNVHDAQDAAQETMLKGLTKLAAGDKPERFRAWLIRVARNLCIDHLRGRKRRKPPAPEPPPALSQQDARAEQDLEQAVRRLPAELRVPLLMFYFDGRSAETIARDLNISHSGVCQKLRLARRQLHEFLTEGSQE